MSSVYSKRTHVCRFIFIIIFLVTVLGVNADVGEVGLTPGYF